ncbi:hypothetical protein [Streptomyces sp. NPDC007063]|uniref:hypothetical protein n=1 Tax=Streptomyces sp. NPDC007063 TaxID=3364772 RepID=UPI003695FE70
MTRHAATPAPLSAPVRHFADPRDGTHTGPRDRAGKEDAFRAASELLPTLRAIVAADLHSLVFRRDWRLIPALRTPDAANERP